MSPEMSALLAALDQPADTYQRAKAQWNLGQATEVCLFGFV
jgi:hypothetical protein